MFKKTESFDDIVFENRNKAYGAYDLRKRYSRRGSVALAISLFILFSAVGAPLIAGMLNKNNDNTSFANDGTFIMTEVDDKTDKFIPPPLPEPVAPSIKQISLKPPVIVDSLTKKEEEFLTNDQLLGQKNNQITDTAKVAIQLPVNNVIPDDQTIYDDIKINEKPIFPGGQIELLKYIAKNTIYPEEALANEVEGTVYIRFAVMKTGEIGNVHIFKASPDILLDNEALRVVKTIPTWIPGKINGNPVNVWFIVPVKFKITSMN